MIKDRLSIFLLLLTLNISVNPVLSLLKHKEAMYVGVALILFFILFRESKTSVSRMDFVIFYFFASLLLLQSLVFDFFPLVTILGFLIRLFIGYATYRLVKDFPKKYIDVLTFLGVLSLVFYVPQQIGRYVGFDFVSLFKNVTLYFGEANSIAWKQTIFIHTFFPLEDLGSYRNAGLFWEPGAFAGYLNLALVLLGLVYNNVNSTFYKKRFFILSICLLTTFSTTGYVVYFVILFINLRIIISMHKYYFFRNVMVVLLIIPIIVYASYYAWKQDFLSNKIQASVNIATRPLKQDSEANRLGNWVFDWKYISSSPFIGWGLHNQTRLSLDPYIKEGDLAYAGRGNGMSDFIAKFGVPAFILWLYIVYRAFILISGGDRLKSGIGLFALALNLNGECFLSEPLFLGLFFLNCCLLQENRTKFFRTNELYLNYGK